MNTSEFKCLLCDWKLQSDNFEKAEMQLFDHIVKTHGVKIASATNQETGETIKFNTEDK